MNDQNETTDPSSIPPPPHISGDQLSEKSRPDFSEDGAHILRAKISELSTGAEQKVPLENDPLPAPVDPSTVPQPEPGFDKETFVTPEKKYFVFDLETFQDELKPEYEEYWIKKKRGRLVDPKKIEAKDAETKGKLATDPRTGQIILGGFYDSVEKEIIQIGLGKATEKLVLQDIIEQFNKFMNSGYTMVSYNGKGFDVPFLYKRALIKGVTIKPIVEYSQLIHKYSNRLHVDLFGVFEEGGKTEWAYLLGLSRTWENQAKDIHEWYINREFKEIRNKNIEDLKETAIIYEAVREWNL